MIRTIQRQQPTLLYRAFSALIVMTFIAGSIVPPSPVYAQTPILNLPIPGAMLPVSPVYTPTMIKGIMIDPANPLQFDFILDTGNSDLEGDEFNTEATKLIKYFLASLTLKEEEMWVNLSPYEKDRIIPESFGQTEMGRDLLAQDYLLKQLTASLMYPEDELGKTFWDKIYTKAKEEFGTSEIPVDTFNKVWIVPESANVFEHEKGAYVVDSHLSVMLDSDYQAKNFTSDVRRKTKDVAQVDTSHISRPTSYVTEQIIRKIILPEIEKEVNHGKTFANLRQIYHSMILATWYKQNLKESLLSKVYVNKNRIKGVEQGDSSVNQQIYNQYMEAFKKGVFNYIKEDVVMESQQDSTTTSRLPSEAEHVLLRSNVSTFELRRNVPSKPTHENMWAKKNERNSAKEGAPARDTDPATQETIPRKYFSGGFANNLNGGIVHTQTGSSPLAINQTIEGQQRIVTAAFRANGNDYQVAMFNELARASSPATNREGSDERLVEFVHPAMSNRFRAMKEAQISRIAQLEQQMGLDTHVIEPKSKEIPNAFPNVYRVSRELFSLLDDIGMSRDQFMEFLGKLRQQLINQGVLKYNDPLKILEIGSGRENALLDIFEMFEEGWMQSLVELHGTNIALENHESEVQFHKVTDMENLPFSDGEYHLVISRFAISYAADPFKVIEEIDRVLSPYGKALLSQYVGIIKVSEARGKPIDLLSFFHRISQLRPDYGLRVTPIRSKEEFPPPGLHFLKVEIDKKDRTSPLIFPVNLTDLHLVMGTFAQDYQLTIESRASKRPGDPSLGDTGTLETGDNPSNPNSASASSPVNLESTPGVDIGSTKAPEAVSQNKLVVDSGPGGSFAPIRVNTKLLDIREDNISIDRAKAYAAKLTEMYNFVRDIKDIKHIFHLLADPQYNIDEYIPNQPELKAWVKSVRERFPDIFLPLFSKDNFRHGDILFNSEGNAVVVLGRPKSGKGSIVKALHDIGGRERLSVGSEDRVIIFYVGGHGFAATFSKRKQLDQKRKSELSVEETLQHEQQTHFRARAFGGRIPLNWAPRVGRIHAFIMMKKEPLDMGHYNAHGYKINETLAMNLKEINHDHMNSNSQLFVPIIVVRIYHILNRALEYGRLAQDVYERLWGGLTDVRSGQAVDGEGQGSLVLPSQTRKSFGEGAGGMGQGESRIGAEGASVSSPVDGDQTTSDDWAAQIIKAGHTPLYADSITGEEMELLDEMKIAKGLKAAVAESVRDDQLEIIIPQRPVLLTMNPFVWYSLIENVENRAFANKAEIKTNVEDGHLLIDVIDNGVGVDPDIRESIFDWGVTSVPRGGYGGVGLAVARTEARISGGEFYLFDTLTANELDQLSPGAIRERTKEGKLGHTGAIFRFRFPLEKILLTREDIVRARKIKKFMQQLYAGETLYDITLEELRYLGRYTQHTIQEHMLEWKINNEGNSNFYYTYKNLSEQLSHDPRLGFIVERVGKQLRFRILTYHKRSDGDEPASSPLVSRENIDGIPAPQDPSDPSSRDPGFQETEDRTINPNSTSASSPVSDSVSSPANGNLTVDDYARIQALPQMQELPYRFDFPWTVLEDYEADLSSDEMILEKLRRMPKFVESDADLQDFAFQQAKYALEFVTHIQNYFARQYPSFRPLSIALYGSYLWSNNPRDLDIQVIVEGNTLLDIEIENISAIFPEPKILKAPIKKVSIFVLGRETLEKDIEPNVGEGLFYDPKMFVNSKRSRFDSTHFIMWGQDFMKVPIYSENIHAEISNLLIKAYLRLTDTYIKDQPESFRFRKAAKRMSTASRILHGISADIQVPENILTDIRRIARKEQLSTENKRKVIEAYEIIFETFQRFLTAQVNGSSIASLPESSSPIHPVSDQPGGIDMNPNNAVSSPVVVGIEEKVVSRQPSIVSSPAEDGRLNAESSTKARASSPVEDRAMGSERVIARRKALEALVERFGFSPNVAGVPWNEQVRQRKQPIPSLADKNRNNYWANLHDVRWKFVELIKAFRAGKIIQVQEFIKYLEQMNTLLFHGYDGKTPYKSNAMRNAEMEYRTLEIGKVEASEEQLKALFVEFQEFINLTHRETRLETVIRQISDFYFVAMGQWGYDMPYIFDTGSNPQFMNMVNGMLRLYGLNGISHGTLDIRALGRASSREDLKESVQNYLLEKVQEVNTIDIEEKRGIKIHETIMDIPLSQAEEASSPVDVSTMVASSDSSGYSRVVKATAHYDEFGRLLEIRTDDNILLLRAQPAEASLAIGSIHLLNGLSEFPSYPYSLTMQLKEGGTIVIIKNFDAPVSIAELTEDGQLTISRFNHEGKPLVPESWSRLINDGSATISSETRTGLNSDLNSIPYLKALFRIVADKELRNILRRSILRSAIGILPGITKETSDNRLVKTHRLIRSLVEKIRQMKPNVPVIIGDFGSSDARTTRELGQSLEDLPVELIAVDHIFNLRTLWKGDSSATFDTGGNLWQIKIGDKIFKNFDNENQELQRRVRYFKELYQSFEQGQSFTWIDPEAEFYRDRHPRRLDFVESDIFDVRASENQYDIVRIFNFFTVAMRQRFNSRKIREGISNVGRQVKIGGYILVGYTQNNDIKYALWQRMPDQLIRLYDSQSDPRGDLFYDSQEYDKTQDEHVYLLRDIPLAGLVENELDLANTESSMLDSHPSSSNDRVSSPVTINFIDSRMDSVDQQLVRKLLNETKLIEKTISRSYGIDLKQSEISSVNVRFHSNIGKNRLVYKVVVNKYDKTQPIASFIMKISRGTRKDIDTVRQAVLSKVVNNKLDRPFGFTALLDDERIVITGPFIEGYTLRDELQISSNNDELFTAVVKESVEVWKELGGYFILDPTDQQFIITYPNGKNGQPQAVLIDKGSFRVTQSMNFQFNVDENKEVNIISEDVNINNLEEWLSPVSEAELMIYLIYELSIPAAPHTSYSDPDMEAMAIVEKFQRNDLLKMKSIVQGVLDALGRPKAIEFFKAFKNDPIKQRIDRLDELEEQIDLLLPEVSSSSPVQEDQPGGIDMNPENSASSPATVMKVFKTPQGVKFGKNKTDLETLGISYSYLKFGRRKEIEKFSQILAEKIKREIGKEITANQDDWIVVVPGGVEIPSAGSLLSREVAKKLKLPHVILKAPKKNLRRRITGEGFQSQDWTLALESISETDQVFDLRDKKVIFIDDGVATGIILELYHDYFTQAGVLQIEPFVLARLFGADDIEKTVDTQILQRFGLAPLIEILNDERSIYTTRAIFHSFKMDETRFKQFAGKLNKKARLNLYLYSLQYLGIESSPHLDILVEAIENDLNVKFPGFNEMKEGSSPDLFAKVIQALKDYEYRVPLRAAESMAERIWSWLDDEIDQVVRIKPQGSSSASSPVEAEPANRATPASSTISTKPEDYLVAFRRNEKGKIIPVYSFSPYFRSERQVPDDEDFTREMRIIPLTKKKINTKKKEFSSDWEQIPAELKQLYEDGVILFTAQPNEETSEYSILMSVIEDPEGNLGRTGVLLKNQEPIIVEADGNEFIVEIKGAGGPDGGFAVPHFRVALDGIRRTVTGGLGTTLANAEFKNLEIKRRNNGKFQQGDTPRALLNLHFQSDGKEAQGYIMRLSPMTERASFTGNEAFDNIHNSETSIRNISYLGEELGESLALDRPLIHLTPHPENLIVLDGGKKHVLTDYSDLRPLDSDPFPLISLTNYFGQAREVVGYDYQTHWVPLLQGVYRELSSAGLISDDAGDSLLNAKTPEEAALILWSDWVALRTYEERKKFGYFPQDLLLELNSQIADFETTNEDLLLNRAEYLLREINEEIAKIERRLKFNDAELKRRYGKTKSYYQSILIQLQSTSESIANSSKSLELLSKLQLSDANEYFIWRGIYRAKQLIERYLTREVEYLQTARATARRNRQEHISSEIEEDIALIETFLVNLLRMNTHQFFRIIQQDVSSLHQWINLPSYNTSMEELTAFQTRKDVSVNLLSISNDYLQIRNSTDLDIARLLRTYEIDARIYMARREFDKTIKLLELDVKVNEGLDDSGEILVRHDMPKFSISNPFDLTLQSPLSLGQFLVLITTYGRALNIFEELYYDEILNDADMPFFDNTRDILQKFIPIFTSQSFPGLTIAGTRVLNNLVSTLPFEVSTLVASPPIFSDRVENEGAASSPVGVTENNQVGHQLPVTSVPSAEGTGTPETGDQSSNTIRKQPGGIDMNPNNLNLQTQGRRFDFDIPTDSIDIGNIRIDGLTPVIINVTPLTNLPLLLGLADDQNEDTQQVEYDPGRDPMDNRVKAYYPLREKTNVL